MHGMQSGKVTFYKLICRFLTFKTLFVGQIIILAQRFYRLITITVNGDSKSIEAGTSVWDFVSSLNLDPTKVAVERNLEIVPKSTFEKVALTDGDQLEIVHFIGGG